MPEHPRDPTAAGPVPTLGALEAVVGALGQVVVGFSGGADSSLLAYVARRVLGRQRAVCITAVSPSLAAEELGWCRALAAEWDLDWRTIPTAELAVPAYVANGTDRCYHCKAELMSVLVPAATSTGATVVLGVNLDDLGDHRPGQLAAAERGARFPLVEARLTKAAVRSISREIGLRTADKPAAACLASRVPYGSPVTFEVLDRIGRAESGLKALGLEAVRVRHYGDAARLEVPVDELGDVLARREAVVAAVASAGYRYVTLDLEGLRSGNLNEAAGIRSPGTRGT